MIIQSVSDLFEKFKLSWGATGFLAFFSGIDLLPVFSQVILVMSLQIISIIVDYVRQKLKIRSRENKELDLPESGKEK